MGSNRRAELRRQEKAASRPAPIYNPNPMKIQVQREYDRVMKFDWSIVNAMLNGLTDVLPDTNKAHGGDWLKDWLKDFMWEYDLDPAYLLMEEKDEGTEKEISR